MFAKLVIRCSRPLQQNFRSYATEATPSKSSSVPWIVGIAAVGAGVAGYTFLGNSKVPLPVVKAEEKHQDPAPQAAKTFTGGDQGFVDLKLAEVHKYNDNTTTFKFELPEKDQVSGLSVASAILTKFKAPDAEKPTIRPYTPVNDEDARGYLELLVKKYEKGAMSSHIHSLKPGDTLSFKGPLPKYPWSTNKHEHITLIAGGTGITPMYQLIRAVFNNPEDKTKVSLVFGNISDKDILLREEFEKLEKDYPQRFRAFYTLDSPPKDWKYGKGFINKDLLKSIIPDPKSENIKIFVCGPPPLYKAVSGPKVSPQDQGDLTGILKDLGYSKEQVYKF